MNLEQLATQIAQVHETLYKKATSAVNVSLTLRNWFIGYYIVEYEQKGEDRAKYGKKLIRTLSNKLKGKISGMSFTNLNMYRKFYLVYPQIIQALPEQLNNLIIRTASEQLSSQKIQPLAEQNNAPIIRAASEQFYIFENKVINVSVSEKSNTIVPPAKTLTKLSYSHLEELIKIENPLKRAFYEVECINGVWSTRELERQINSLYYERMGLSMDKEKLSQIANRNAETIQPIDIIKNPFTFEFLGLPVSMLLEENQLEKALIDNLEQFLLELGYGFCFEARQKRILIDDEYFYIDLVFYHRILKCHILIEIKTEKFTHENIGQLNVYLQYYKDQIMQKTDNPPVGILLCTKSKPLMVKYATAANEQLFVSEYRLNLPSEEEIQTYIESKIIDN